MLPDTFSSPQEKNLTLYVQIFDFSLKPEIMFFSQVTVQSFETQARDHIPDIDSIEPFLKNDEGN